MTLASELEPLILADGTKIDPSTGSVIKEKKASSRFIEVPAAREAQALVAKSRRAISDLPIPSNQMNAVSLVLFYTLYGLNDQDMAIITGLSKDQIKNIRELEEYKTIQSDIRTSVLEFEANDVRGYLQTRAYNAAEKVVELLEEDGALGLAAAKDILDRTGHRPADVVEHRHKMEDALRIEVIERKDTSNVPVIEGSFIDVTPGKEM